MDSDSNTVTTSSSFIIKDNIDGSSVSLNGGNSSKTKKKKSISEGKKFNFDEMNQKAEELYKDELASAIQHLNSLSDYAKVFSTKTPSSSYEALVFIGWNQFKDHFIV